MISKFHLASAIILFAAAASSGPMSEEIAKRWRSKDDSEETLVYRKNPGFSGSNVRQHGKNDEDGGDAWRESTAEELASATGENHPKNLKENRGSIEDRWRNDIPGDSGLDYPNYGTIPLTSFTCLDKDPGGYYADGETGCQVFHVCNNGGVKTSFLCPPGSVFNQKHLVCDWWYSVDCNEADGFSGSRNATPRLDHGNDEKASSDSHVVKLLKETPMMEKYLKIDVTTSSSDDERRFSPGKQMAFEKKNGPRLPNDFANIARAYSSDSRRALGSHENRENRDRTPRGFSRHNDDESSIRKSLDWERGNFSNELASYVNYAYFA